MKLFKKNQIIIYVIVLMVMTAGYLNYTTKTEQQASVETAMQMESNDDMQLADIGDATLVNSEDVVSESANESNNTSENQTDSNTNTNNENANQTNETNNTVDDYFTKSKLERDTMYSQMIETYEKILNSTNSLETQKQTAAEEIAKINNTKNSIMICENLIRTKGFENNVVFVNNESVSVIIGAEEIQQEEIAQIQNIIARELKAEIENIHIAKK